MSVLRNFNGDVLPRERFLKRSRRVFSDPDLVHASRMARMLTQLIEPPFEHELAFVENDDVVANLLDVVQKMRRQHDRWAFAVEPTGPKSLAAGVVNPVLVHLLQAAVATSRKMVAQTLV